MMTQNCAQAVIFVAEQTCKTRCCFDFGAAILFEASAASVFFSLDPKKSHCHVPFLLEKRNMRLTLCSFAVLDLWIFFCDLANTVNVWCLELQTTLLVPIQLPWSSLIVVRTITSCESWHLVRMFWDVNIHNRKQNFRCLFWHSYSLWRWN